MVAMTQNQNFKSSGHRKGHSVQFSHSVMCESAIPWTAARQASLSITNYQSWIKLRSIESVMSYNHLILWRPLFLLHSVLPSIRVFSNESVLHTRWPKYWGFSFFFFFPFIFISWRLITLQYCSGFCHTLTWISHGFTCVPLPDLPSRLPLHPIPWGFSFSISLSN